VLGSVLAAVAVVAVRPGDPGPPVELALEGLGVSLGLVGDLFALLGDRSLPPSIDN
jgi:hypothetical protein